MATTGAVALGVVFACLMGAGAGAAPSAPAFTGVWDAYPAAFISVCPHLPRNPVAWDKLNGRWFVLEKGGLWPAETLCEVHFRVEGGDGGGGGEGRNLTLHVAMAAASDGEAAQRRDATWTMSSDNVWRDREMSLFVGLSGGARSLLLLCAVEAAGAAAGEAAEAAREGYSLALARRPQDFRPDALARELKRARLSDQVLATDRAACAPAPAPDSAR